MTRSTIGGPVRYDWLTDHARIANRPTDAEGMRLAAIELQRSGLKPADIGGALGLSAAAVEQLLREATDE